MKKFLLLFACFATLGLTGSAAYAQNSLFTDQCSDKSTASSTVCTESSKEQTNASNSLYGKNGIILKVVNVIAVIAAITAVIVIIIAGLRYIVSAGDSAKVTAARNTILYAVIGLVVIALARPIIGFVVSKL